MEELWRSLAQSRNVRFAGIWNDPWGKFPPMLLFELHDPPPEAWNRAAAERPPGKSVPQEEEKSHAG